MELIRGDWGSGSSEKNIKIIRRNRSLDDFDIDNKLVEISPFSLAYVMLTTFALGGFVGAAIALSSVSSRDNRNWDLNKIIQEYDFNGNGRLEFNEFEAYLKSR